MAGMRSRRGGSRSWIWKTGCASWARKCWGSRGAMPRRHKRGANGCLLQAIVETFEDGLNACLDFTALWLGDKTASQVELFKDFGVDSLSDASATLLLDATQGGLVSAETF